jgi:HAD superfamily hydrolase (TIGR01509 family)
MKLQALIFDCDGVLVDTELDGHRVSFNQAFRDAGLKTEWSAERYGELLLTAGGKERMRRHFDETEWPVEPSDRDSLIAKLHKLKTDIFMNLIGSGKLPLRPGVQRIVDEALGAGVTLAVCSTSNERAVQSVVDVMLGAARSTRITVFAGDVVAAKKPAPDIYLLAAKTLALDPARCMVIEDSNNGLRAAKAAGMRCIVTKSTYTVDEDFRLADKIVDNLDEGVTIKLCEDLVTGSV